LRTGEMTLEKKPTEKHGGSFGRLGTSRYISNITGRRSIGQRHAVELSWNQMYDPLYLNFNIPPSPHAEFELYVDRLVMAEFEYLAKRLRRAGLDLNVRVFGQIDLQWLSEKTTDEFPVPFLIEQFLEDPTPNVGPITVQVNPPATAAPADKMKFDSRRSGGSRWGRIDKAIRQRLRGLNGGWVNISELSRRLARHPRTVVNHLPHLIEQENVDRIRQGKPLLHLNRWADDAEPDDGPEGGVPYYKVTDAAIQAALLGNWHKIVWLKIFHEKNPNEFWIQTIETLGYPKDIIEGILKNNRDSASLLHAA
jgi:hypothetical protein